MSLSQNKEESMISFISPSRTPNPEKQMRIALATLIALGSAFPALAEGTQPGYANNTGQCATSQYKEEYVPGNKNSPGYVRTWNEAVQVPCSSLRVRTQPTQHPQQVGDMNDCSEGSLIGGLLGAGLATTGSRGRDRWWAIPAGGAAGAMLGCQIDGG